MNSLSNDAALAGNVFAIQRYCTHDGPGIRTTVFLKGCPLRCIWCHNPESQSFSSEISYREDVCLSCGSCVGICEAGCHRLENGKHILDRAKCFGCGKCVSVCPSSLETVGKKMTVDEVMENVMRDRAFYGENGGLTLSGGEPFAQSEFAIALLKKAKEEGITTCVETCGFCKPDVFSAALPYVDLFLYDYKETSPEKHSEYTGVDNSLILDNLSRLNEAGAKIVLRCPIIPGYNDTEAHFLGIAETAKNYGNVIRIELEPGHTIGEAKKRQLGYKMKNCEFDSPSTETVLSWIEFIGKNTTVKVKKS